MSIVIEEPETSKPQLRKFKAKPTSPSSHSPPAAAAPANSFQFRIWFFLSLNTLLFITFSYVSPQDPKTTWFLNLPPILRSHYSSGQTVKVQTAPNLPQIELFSIQKGPNDSDSHVLIVHGIGCSSFAFRNVVASLGHKNVHAVAIDLPGSGFSNKTLVEFGSEEMGKVLGQVIDSMGLGPVDLVLHDSALALSANWILENRALVRSLVVLDGGTSGTAFPIGALGVPVVRELVLGSRFLFGRVVASCCMKSVGGPEADAHRILLKGRDGVYKAVVGMGKKLNLSFDLSEWGGRDEVKGLPVRVLWSNERAEEGRRIFADALPMAPFGTHSGGRWVEEENAEEVAKSIYEFISSLPKVGKQVLEESGLIDERVERGILLVVLFMSICVMLFVLCYFLVVCFMAASTTSSSPRTTVQQPPNASLPGRSAFPTCAACAGHNHPFGDNNPFWVQAMTVANSFFN